MPAQSCSAANSPRRNMPSMYSKESTEDGSTPSCLQLIFGMQCRTRKGIFYGGCSCYAAQMKC